MRKLLVLLPVTLLAGCFSPPSPQSNAYVRLYQSQEELIGVNYHAVGKASGSSCQLLQQDRPATISDARSDLQRNAAKLGDAVIIDRCESISSFNGCYRASVCEGTVIKIGSN